MASPEQRQHRPGDLTGTIRHRLLINRLADPAEVAPRLPGGLRPHVGPSGGVVVGCCLIVIDSARPWPLPAPVGPTIRAAAHRISVEAGPIGDPTRAVYVPLRHTDSITTVAIGGRLFPGLHSRARVEASATDEAVRWSIRSTGGDDDGFSISATADLVGATPPDADGTGSEIAEIVIGTRLGLSPDSRGRLEGADMVPSDPSAVVVRLTDLDSGFLDGFATAEEAETLLMTDVGVAWRRAAVPTDQDASARTTAPSTINQTARPRPEGPGLPVAPRRARWSRSAP